MVDLEAQRKADEEREKERERRLAEKREKRRLLMEKEAAASSSATRTVGVASSAGCRGSQRGLTHDPVLHTRTPLADTHSILTHKIAPPRPSPASFTPRPPGRPHGLLTGASPESRPPSASQGPCTRARSQAQGPAASCLGQDWALIPSRSGGEMGARASLLTCLMVLRDDERTATMMIKMMVDDHGTDTGSDGVSGPRPRPCQGGGLGGWLRGRLRDLLGR
jgi:hypothetical protein